MNNTNSKITDFLKSHIVGILLIGIFSSLIASYIYSWVQTASVRSSSTNINLQTNIVKKTDIPTPLTVQSRPLPREITEEISKRPPFQQEETAAHYIGQRFRWRVALVSAKKSSAEQVRIMFLDRGNYPWVFCEVPIALYPSLQTAKEGQEFHITGTVAKANSGTIDLTDVLLE